MFSPLSLVFKLSSVFLCFLSCFFHNHKFPPSQFFSRFAFLPVMTPNTNTILVNSVTIQSWWNIPKTVRPPCIYVSASESSLASKQSYSDVSSCSTCWWPDVNQPTSWSHRLFTLIHMRGTLLCSYLQVMLYSWDKSACSVSSFPPLTETTSTQAAHQPTNTLWEE